MRKKFAHLLLVLFTLINLFTLNVFADDSISVFINDQKIEFETPPIIINDRTMVPMRSIFEALGYSVTWESKNKIILGVKGDFEILMQVGNPNAFINKQSYTLDATPIIIDGRTFVPLRFISESTNIEPIWNVQDRTINMYTEGYVPSAVVEVPHVSEEPPKTTAAETYLEDSVVSITTNKLQGSGVVIGEDGYIVTCYHVIKNSDYIAIKFNNGEVYTGEAYITDYNISKDLALIKIDRTGLIPAKLYEDEVKSGYNVETIGYPLGEFKKTNGMVKTTTHGVITTTAPIEHGSSGGALFYNGELAGITSAYSNENYFSTPVKYVMALDRDGRYSISEASHAPFKPEVPENVTVKTEGLSAYISWDYAYGVDYYYVYKSDTIDGYYEAIENPLTESDVWFWNYPNCVGLTANGPFKSYYIIAAVVGEEVSDFSEPIEVNVTGE